MPATGDTTRRILERMEAGDRESFDRFFERQGARLLVYITYNMGRRLRRRLEPTDILQNLSLRLFRGFGAFVSRARERGVWAALIRMADHEITEAYRYHFKVDKRSAKREITAMYLKETGEGGEGPLDLAASPATSASQRLLRREEYQETLRHLAELSPLEQFVTVSRVIGELSTQEIGERLGKTRGAVQMIFSRARDKLRKRAEGGRRT